jgi:uncharacterized protein (TIRG00374 family)
LKKALLSLVLVAALFGVIVILTEAQQTLEAVNPTFFLMASSFFILSILVWVVSWAYLIKRKEKIPYSKLVIVGFSSVFGALTPVQIGAEALRSIKLKKHFNVSYTDSVSASMVVKGTKFLLLALFSSFILFFYLIESLSGFDPLLFIGFSSGFLVVVLATLLFLLPLNKKFGRRISRLFFDLARTHNIFEKLGGFFENYSTYLSETRKSDYLIIFVLSFLSWVLEFLALQYSFLALNINLPLFSALVLLLLVSVLERTPFLPRGIGLVEVVGYNYLAFPVFSKVVGLTVSMIGAVLIVYGVVRLVVPTVLSILFNIAFRKL